MEAAANENDASPEQLIKTQSLSTVAAFAAMRLPAVLPTAAAASSANAATAPAKGA